MTNIKWEERLVLVPMVDVTVLVPTKNEEITVGQFVDWCFEGFKLAGVTGEVILIDNSDDKTALIAKEHGAIVVPLNQPGLGRAYLEGKRFVRGNWIILGDADCTYDFRRLGDFIDKLKEGFDFVVGNRFIGTIEKGAMPLHHRYFGSPATSFIFKRTLQIPSGDIHCGMRALSKQLFLDLPFAELGWVYASEMIVSARNLNARIAEIPINFLKEPKGRISHHKRDGWLSPFKAGWSTLRVVASYSLSRIFMKPGIILSFSAMLVNLLIAVSPMFFLERFKVGLFAQSVLLVIAIVGGFSYALGGISQYVYSPSYGSGHWLAKKGRSDWLFSVSVVLVAINIFTILFQIVQWLKNVNKNLVSVTLSQRLTSFWFAETSVAAFILSITILSLIYNVTNKRSESLELLKN
jgi:glycosyltransferase involved in cell wall biosynthesis